MREGVSLFLLGSIKSRNEEMGNGNEEMRKWNYGNYSL